MFIIYSMEVSLTSVVMCFLWLLTGAMLWVNISKCILLQVPTLLHRDRLGLDDLLWHSRNNPPSHRGILERVDGKLKSNLK